MGTPPEISVVVCAYNRERLIKQCIGSLLNQSISNYEILIIDDGSTDQTKEILQGFRSDKVRIFYNPTRRGPSYSRNRGIKESRGQYITFTDSDCVVDKNWLNESVKPFAKDERVMITGGKIVDPSPQNYWQRVNIGSNFIAKESQYVRYVIGCNMAFRKEFLLRNLFDESWPYAAGEERDLCQRCTKQHGKIYYTDSACVTHVHRSTLLSTLRQQFYYGFANAHFTIKNKQFPFLSYGSWILLLALLTAILKFFDGTFYSKDSLGFFFLYAILTFVVQLKSRERMSFELLFTYPGFLLKCLADSCGNVWYILVSLLNISKTRGTVH